MATSSAQPLTEILGTPDELKTRALQHRAEGNYSAARDAFEQWETAVGTPYATLENFANFCDLARCAINLDEALSLAEQGESMAANLALGLGLSLDSTPDLAVAGGFTPDETKFWFAYCKVLNFKGLTLQNQFDASWITSGGPDNRLCAEAIRLQDLAYNIATSIGSGYARKVALDRISAYSEHLEHAAAAKQEAHKNAEASSQDLEARFQWLMIEVRALQTLGSEEDPVVLYNRALAAADEIHDAQTPRKRANVIVELSGLMLQNDQIDDLERLQYLSAESVETFRFLTLADCHYRNRYLIRISSYLESQGRVNELPSTIRDLLAEKVKE